MYRAVGLGSSTSRYPWLDLPIGGPVRAVSGLGAVFNLLVEPSIGPNINFAFNVPYEKLAKDAVAFAIKSAKPELPGLIAAAMPAVTSALEKQLPVLLPMILKEAEAPLEKYIVTRLWPNTLRPIVLAEIQKGTAQVSTVAGRASLVAGGALIAGVAAFLILRKKK